MTDQTPGRRIIAPVPKHRLDLNTHNDTQITAIRSVRANDFPGATAGQVSLTKRTWVGTMLLLLRAGPGHVPQSATRRRCQDPFSLLFPDCPSSAAIYTEGAAAQIQKRV
jgi:hypothetical protein